MYHFAKDTTHFQLLSTAHSSIYWMKCYSFPRNSEYDGGFELMAQCFFTICNNGLVIIIVSSHSIYITSQNLENLIYNSKTKRVHVL
jgi:hypothetical protein